MATEEEHLSKVERGVRLDLAIAVCALLISTLAAGASWWQARVLQAQTLVLQEQLGAQVWPYVSVSEGLTGDKVDVSVSNVGLGPAIVRSVSASLNGIPESSATAIFHAVLGPHVIARVPHGQRFAFSIDSSSPGAVIRPGDRGLGFSLTNEKFARPFLRGLRRLTFRICYCAIIPGKCWITETGSPQGAEAVAGCPELAGDLLHSSAVDELSGRAL